ncbi:MAG: hypothetical protein ABI565_08350 [Vicinamibacteria bacterium]
MRLSTLTVPTLLLMSALPAHAQQPAPTGVLVMTREQFRPGNMTPHNKLMPSFYALYEKAKVGPYRLGLLPMSGDTNHLVFLESYSSYADMATSRAKVGEVIGAAPALQAEMDALQKQNSPLHDSQTTWIAVRRNDLSYHPKPAAEVAKVRYVTLTVARVNFGRGTDYSDYIKQTNAAREKANLDEHTSVYSVTSGAPAGTFLTFTSVASMAEADAAMADGPARTKKLTEALGGDIVVKARQKMLSELVATSTTTLYSVNRGISRPSPEYVAADPTFWAPVKAMEPAKPVKK